MLMVLEKLTFLEGYYIFANSHADDFSHASLKHEKTALLIDIMHEQCTDWYFTLFTNDNKCVCQFLIMIVNTDAVKFLVYFPSAVKV